MNWIDSVMEGNFRVQLFNPKWYIIVPLNLLEGSSLGHELSKSLRSMTERVFVPICLPYVQCISFLLIFSRFIIGWMPLISVHFLCEHKTISFIFYVPEYWHTDVFRFTLKNTVQSSLRYRAKRTTSGHLSITATYLKLFPIVLPIASIQGVTTTK